jgi:hypothetical protein
MASYTPESNASPILDATQLTNTYLLALAAARPCG